MPTTADAKALIAELEALPGYKLEVAGGALFEQAYTLEDDGEYLDAVNVYKSVLKKAPDTKIAAAAEKRAKDLIDKGMPGFSEHCEKRRQGRKACEKHAKPVKL